VQPRTHAFLIRSAVAQAASPWLEQSLPHLLDGNDAEDDFVIAGLRLRTPGLTHTYRPGSRFGELGAPSALTRLLRCWQRAALATDPKRAAFWLGRACHLLGDMAVPARARGVWHLLGDPLELFCEAHVEDLASLLPAALPERAGPPTAHAESLARAASAERADTTRTPWGALRFRLLGRGERLTHSEVERQARLLVPLAVSHTCGLLRHYASVSGSGQTGGRGPT
jgi:hypothetical protein